MRIKKYYYVLLIFLIVVSLVFGYVQLQRQDQVRELENVEIRDYEGEDLSLISDFRENSIMGPQHINITDYRLEISGLVENPRDYTYEEVLNHRKFSKIVELHCVEGWSVKILWEGILIKDLLNEVKVSPEAKIIIFYAHDGYSTSLPLEYILNNDILMAHKMNNVVLPPERGFPFQLVAEEKWGYKWIKWITMIELSDDVNYKGYWESRGYNQKGDVDGPVFN